jgi:hypothetical protein
VGKTRAGSCNIEQGHSIQKLVELGGQRKVSSSDIEKL